MSSFAEFRVRRFYARPEMIAFEVTRNGQRICTAGVEGYGVVTAIVTWVSRDADALSSYPVERREEAAHEELQLQVGGLTSDGPNAGTHHDWASTPLEPGDEVLVRISDTASPDAPSHSRPPDPERELSAQRDYVRQMCQRWGWQLTEL